MVDERGLRNLHGGRMTCRGFSPRKAPGAGRGRARRLPGGLAVAGAVAYQSAMSRVQSLLWVSVIALSSALVAGCGHHRPVVDPALSPALEAQASGQASASMPGAQRVGSLLTGVAYDRDEGADFMVPLDAGRCYVFGYASESDGGEALALSLEPRGKATRHAARRASAGGAEPLRRRERPVPSRGEGRHGRGALRRRPLRIARVARRACADATGSRAVGFTQGPGAGAPAVGSPSSRPRGRGRP